ncbi:MAG: PAS domain-containing protein, partial [Leptospirillia bacterium]
MESDSTGSSEIQGDSREWLLLLLEMATDATYITDKKGLLVFSVPSLANSLGYRVEELLHRPISLWEPEWAEDRLTRHIEEILALPPARILTVETWHKRRDGTLFPVEIRSRPFIRNGTSYALHCARDISRQKSADRERKTLSDSLQLLIEANRTLLSPPDKLSLYHTLCRLASSLEGIALAWIGHPGEDGDFHILASNGENGWLDSVRIPSSPEIAGIPSAPYLAWKSGEPVYNLGFEETRPGEATPFALQLREVISRFGFKSQAAIPITGDEEERLVLTLYYHHLPMALDTLLQEVLSELARDLSRGLERLQILRSCQEALALKKALLHNALPGILLIRDRTIVTVNARLLEILGYERSEEIEGKSVRCLLLDDEEFLRVGSLLYPAVLHEGRVRVTDVRGRRKTGEPLWADLFATTTKIGDEELLVAIIHDITELHLHARALERIAAVNEFHAQSHVILATVEDEKRLFKDLCDLAMTQLGVVLSWIGTPNPHGKIEFLAASGVTDLLREFPFSVGTDSTNGQEPTGRAFREGRAIFETSLSHSSGSSSWEESARRYGIKSLAVLPVFHKGRLWGLFSLYFGNRQEFEEPVRSILEEFAQSLSRGLDRLDLRSAERRTSALNAAILEASSLGIILTEGSVVRFANTRMEELLHRSGPFEGRRILEILGDPAEPPGLEAGILVPSRQKKRLSLEIPIDLPENGEPRWLEMSGVPFEQEGFDTLWTLSDITLRKNAREEEILLARALAAVHEGVIIIDSQRRIIYTNEAFTTMTGYRHDEVVGRDCRFLQGERSDRETVDEIRRALDSGQNFRGQILNYRKDGSTFWNQLTLAPVRNPGGSITHFVGILNDITEIRDLLEQNTRLTFSAQHDPLTGLLNRAALDDHLLRLVARKNRQGGGFIVGILDLDDFKPVNDTFGHAAGDTLLQEIARRLSSTIRSHDFIARLGGDEFALVVEDIVNPEAPEFHPFLERLHQTVETPFEVLPGRMTHMGLSLGIAFYPSDALDPETLLREADRALCHIKEKKLARDKWWHLAGDPEAGLSSREIDPYDDVAKALLEKYADSIDPAVERFVEAFYRKLDSLPESRTLLEPLGEDGRRRLALRQSEHLRFLLSPRTRWEEILSRAKIVGQIHCLSGVSNSLLVAGMNLYRKLVGSQIHRGLVPDRDRIKILAIVDQRIEDHIRTELEAEIATIGRYMEATLAELPFDPSQDACPEIDLLKTLPGILGVFYLSLPPQSQAGVILASTGPQKEILAPLFEEAYDREALLEISTLRTRSLRDPELPESFRKMAQTHIRSLLEIPIGAVDQEKTFAGPYDHWIVMAGEHLNQFNSSWARQFSRSFRQRVEKRLQGELRTSGIHPEIRAAYRTELRHGGLSMYMQPVVDLKTNGLTRVEALARLTRPNGEVVMPELFLPTLTESDLEWLFQEGLDQSLSHLALWDRGGLVVDLSINIAPTTLVHPACGEWIIHRLQRYQIPPSRLTLEVLENQILTHSSAFREAISRLLALGINLSMDDMGSEYSTLQRMAALPFDKIKIDQSLLRHIRVNPLETLGIIGAIVQMGRELGHGIVVEGLEDDGMIEM